MRDLAWCVRNILFQDDNGNANHGKYSYTGIPEQTLLWGTKSIWGVTKVQYSGDDKMNRLLSDILNSKHEHVHRETWMRLKYHSNYTDKYTFLKWKIISVRKQMEKAKMVGEKCRSFKACFHYKVKSLLPLKSSSASQDSNICFDLQLAHYEQETPMGCLFNGALQVF